MPDRFYELIRHLHVGVVVQGPSTEVLVCNRAALDLLGLEEDQYRGKTSYDPDWNIVHEDGTPFEADQRPMASVLATGKPVRNVVMGVYRPRRRDRVWLLVNAQPELDTNGCIIQVVATLIDITERKQLESSLVEARKLESIGRLAGGIAHDFNNLLNVITGATSLALMRLPPDARMREELELSLDAANRAAGLTRQLLTFARRREVSLATSDVANVVSSMRTLLARVAGDHVQFEIVTHPDTGSTRMDPVEIEQILVNLVANARDAMPSGGVIRIVTAPIKIDSEGGEVPPGDYTCITVTDSGEGMDSATRERIFEPFFTTKDLGRGTGLGLATVHGVVRQHGGYITVDSAPGQGSCFTIHLARAEWAASEPAPIVLPPAHGGETILVVEDEDALRKLSVRVLKEAGYVVLHARTGIEALRVAEQYAAPIHLLFTDFTMPEMDGVRLATTMRNKYPDLRVLMTSGFAPDARVPRSSWRLLDKPYRLDQLEAEVRSALDESHDS